MGEVMGQHSGTGRGAKITGDLRAQRELTGTIARRNLWRSAPHNKGRGSDSRWNAKGRRTQ